MSMLSVDQEVLYERSDTGCVRNYEVSGALLFYSGEEKNKA